MFDDLRTGKRNDGKQRVENAKLVEGMITSYVLNDGEAAGYEYGMTSEEQKGRTREHNGGGDVAHRYMLIYYPEINAGITTQSNHAQFNSGLAAGIAEAFFADAMESNEGVAETTAGEPFDPETYDPEDFDDFVGRYSLDVAPDFILTFML